jgi:hypothetical protein
LIEEFKNLLPLHPKFTKSVVLIADLESRLKRLEMRKALNPEEVAADDLMIFTDPEKFFAMEEYLVDYAQNYFDAEILDTSKLSKVEVSENLKQVFGL